MSRSTRRAIWALSLAAALTSGRSLGAQDAQRPPLPLVMKSMVMNRGLGSQDPLRIVVERWSTDEEHQLLLDTLSESGSKKLDDVLEKIKPRAGFIDTTNTLSWDMQYTQATPRPEGGWHILFLMYRVNAPSEWDWFDVGEIDVDAEGRGEGTLTVAKKATHDADKNELVMHLHGGREPLRLKLVSVEP